MRLNGGVIGASNQPTNRVAPGVWSAEELRTNQLYGRFPRYYEGWDLTYLINSSPALLSSTSLTGVGAINGLDFKPDGTKLYALDSTDVTEFNLSTPWDTSTASLVGNSIGTTVGQGIAFRPDGRVFFAVGALNPSVRVFTMPTAWTVTTAVRSKFCYIGDVEDTPRGIFIGDSGTKMYIVGANATVYQYSLSPAWDVSTATYSTSYSGISSYETSPNAVAFSTDGLKMYILGQVSDAIHQFNLGTAWDITTSSYHGLKSVNTIPEGLAFKSDGTSVYIADSGGDAVYQYNLSTAWDITTAGSLAASFSINTQSSVVGGVQFNSDGSQMFIIDQTTGYTSQYALSTPWLVSSATFTRSNITVVDATSEDLFFSSDGTRLYILGTTNDRVTEIRLSTAWDITTYNDGILDSTLVPSPNDIVFKPDGTKMYTVSNTTDTVREYNLSGAWDIHTATYVQDYSLTSQTGTATSLSFSSDGLVMYVSDTTKIYYYNLMTAWSISSAVYSYTRVLPPTTIEAITIRESGSNLYLGITGGVVQQYRLGTPGELRSPGDERVSLSVQSQDATPVDVAISNDGRRIYMLGGDGDDVNQYNLSVPWNLSSATYNSTFSVTTEETTPSAIRFKTDGTRMFISGTTGDDINEYSLSTPWEVTTASYVRNFSVGAQEANVGAIDFSPDGLNLYVMGTTGDDVNQYSLSTAWNISTASFVRLFSISAQETVPTGLAFRPDGLRMFVLGSSSDAVHQYDLTTPWDISTASYVKSFGVEYLDLAMTGIAFKTDGTKMYLLGSTAPDSIYELNLG